MTRNIEITTEFPQHEKVKRVVIRKDSVFMFTDNGACLSIPMAEFDGICDAVAFLMHIQEMEK